MTASVSAVVVVDAALALRRSLPGPGRTQARALWLRWEAEETRRITPAIFAGEVASALLRSVRYAGLPRTDAQGILMALLRAVAIAADDALLAPRAFAIADAIGGTKVYDSLYAALAEREGCDLWTADERFFNAAAPHFPWVRWVGQTR